MHYAHRLELWFGLAAVSYFCGPHSDPFITMCIHFGDVKLSDFTASRGEVSSWGLVLGIISNRPVPPGLNPWWHQ